MNIYLDIETLPTNDLEVIAEIAASIKPPSTIKKQESIDAWMAENKEQAIKEAVHKTGLSGLHGRVACISYAFDDSEVYSTGATDSEEQAITFFYSHVMEFLSRERHNGQYQLDAVFIGHNSVGFDLPFLKHRSIILGIKPPHVLLKAFNAKPWDSVVADTMLMWSSDKEKRASMDKLCKAFGIPGKGNFDGSMVAETWPIDPQKVIDYCADDVRRTREMYKRLTFDFPALAFKKAA